jgi:hypothetical protein
MKRFLALLTVVVVAGAAVADVPPPPPPKGKKYVSVSAEVVLGKDVTGYVFVQQVGTGLGRPMFTHEKLELTEGKAKAMAAGGRRTYVSLFAVPQDTAKEFKTDAELFEALGANKVKSAHRIGFPGTATVSDTIKGDSVKWTYTITAIDTKTGIKTKVEGEGYEAPKDGTKKDAPKTGEKKDSPEDEEDAPTTTAPRGGMWIAGLAAFAALTLGGLWIAGRGRRKV